MLILDLQITSWPRCHLCDVKGASYIFEDRGNGPIFKSQPIPLDLPEGVLYLYQEHGTEDDIEWQICPWSKCSKVCVHRIQTIPSQCNHILNKDPKFRSRLDDSSYQDIIGALNNLPSKAGRSTSELETMTAGQVIRRTI